MAKLQKTDFERIKAKQGRGQRLETILRSVPWSKRTVERVMKAGSWSVYRTRINKETRRISEARANGTIKRAKKNGDLLHSNDAGKYEDMESMPGYKRPDHLVSNPGEDFLGRKLKESKKRNSLKERLLHVFSRKV